MHLDTKTLEARWPVKLGLFASILLYSVCLAFPAYSVEGPEGPRVVHSLLELAIGWLGIFYGIFDWLANPLLLLTWILLALRHYKRAVAAAFASTIFAAFFFARTTIVISEAPTYGRILSYHTGYWLWLASSILALLTSYFALKVLKESVKR